MVLKKKKSTITYFYGKFKKIMFFMKSNLLKNENKNLKIDIYTKKELFKIYETKHINKINLNFLSIKNLYLYFKFHKLFSIICFSNYIYKNSFLRKNNLIVLHFNKNYNICNEMKIEPVGYMKISKIFFMKNAGTIQMLYSSNTGIFLIISRLCKKFILDLDSLLCGKNNISIGKLNNIIGSLNRPEYSVFFFSTEDILQLTLSIRKAKKTYFISEKSGLYVYKK
nr:hypothetical protein 1634Bnrm1_p040 [Cryptomonas sp.]